MCYGNTGLYSFAWPEVKDANDDRPVTRSNAKSVCTIWESVEGWARSRMVPFDPPVRRPWLEEEDGGRQ